MSRWVLSRELRPWVPRWLWRVFCFGPYRFRLARFSPFREILTRKVEQDGS